MESVIVRLLPLEAADGPTNMAIDEVLLQSAQRGLATLRFYHWFPPTASLGYFQPASVLKEIAWPDTLPWVRRPSGGLTLIHYHDFTYAFAAPSTFPLMRTGCLTGMHGILKEALAGTAGIDVTMADCDAKSHSDSPLCFLHITPGDLCIGPHKVVGSAQRKQKGAVLQHGSILLLRDKFAPVLPGITDLVGVGISRYDFRDWFVWHYFRRSTGIEVVEGELTSQEREAVADLVKTKYSQSSWNQKR